MDDELDFEEDLDFGNVDSLLYETTDENINEIDDKESDHESDKESDEESNKESDNGSDKESDEFQSCEEDNETTDEKLKEIDGKKPVKDSDKESNKECGDSQSCEEDNDRSYAEVDNRSDGSESPQIEDTNESSNEHKSEELNVNEVNDNTNDDNISDDVEDNSNEVNKITNKEFDHNIKDVVNNTNEEVVVPTNEKVDNNIDGKQNTKEVEDESSDDWEDSSDESEKSPELPIDIPVPQIAVPPTPDKALDLLENFLQNFEEIDETNDKSVNSTPITTQPKRTEQEITQPKRTEPEITQPKRTEPEITQPKKTEPKRTEPVITPPKKTQPTTTQSKRTEPEIIQPKRTESKRTQPTTTQPKETIEPIKINNKTNNNSANSFTSLSQKPKQSLELNQKNNRPNDISVKITITPELRNTVDSDQKNNRSKDKSLNTSIPFTPGLRKTIDSDQKNNRPKDKSIDTSTLIMPGLRKTVEVDQKNDRTNDISLNTSIPITSGLRKGVDSDQKNNKPNDISLNTSILFTPGLRKTVDLDQKYYNSMRIYLTKRKIIGYAEDTFREEAKRFKLKKDGNTHKLMFNGREVIETEERQRNISIEFHLNPSAKSQKSKHRGVSATVRAIESKYFWGTIKFDVEAVINRCRVCNPKEYDLTSYQLWKYIEIGVIESVLIVRDLSEKSSIFNCAFLDKITPQNLSKHLIDMFKTYGTPNAIRIVLENQIKEQFVEKLKEHLRKGLLDFIEEVKFVSQNSTDKEVIKLPMVQILIEYNPIKCPKSEKELQTTYAISVDEEISLFYIFSCDKWLIPDPVFKTISTDIKNFAQKFKDWETKVSSLTLYFQINGINLKANEEEEEDNNPESSTSKSKPKHISVTRELARLQTDFKLYNPWKDKRQIKTKANESDSSSSESNFSSDSDSRDSSSKASQKTKLKNSTKESKDRISHSKEPPFKEVLRQQQLESDSNLGIEVIYVDDSSQQSIISQQSSVTSVLSEIKTPEPPLLPTLEPLISDLEKYDPNGMCQPCAVLLNPFSQEDIEKAIEGDYQFSEAFTDSNGNKDMSHSPIIVSSDSEEETQERSQPSVSSPTTASPTKPLEEYHVKNIINEELKKRSTVEERQPSLDLNLSEESTSEDETKGKKENPKHKKEMTPKATPIKSPVKPISIIKTPLKSQTSVTPKTNSKRRRSAKDSDNDSDYDYQKEEAVKKSNKKRVKFDANPKELVKTQSNQKRRTKQITKRLVASESDSNPESEDENIINNTPKVTPKVAPKKPKPATNSEKKSEIFNCKFCDFSTNEKGNYILHSGKHRDDRKNAILCPDCSKVFYNKDALERHKEEEHPPDFLNTILYGCECKAFGSDTVEQLDEHLMTHIEDLSYLKTTSSKLRCSLCKQFTAPNKEVMTTHLTQKHRMFKCVFNCSFVGIDFQTLERHSKSIHPRYGQPYECRYCEYSSAVFGSLVNHRQKSHVIDWSEQTNRCLLCESRFTYDDTNAIIGHLVTHSIDFEYFECKSCNKRCRKLAEFKKHCETHHGVGPADPLEPYISNLNHLFEDLRQVLSDKNNKIKKMSANSSETQNAILGLMDDQFVDDNEDNNDFSTTNDLVAAALNSAFNDDMMDGSELPTLSIPETNGEEEAMVELEEDDEGNWTPVHF